MRDEMAAIDHLQLKYKIDEFEEVWSKYFLE